MLAGGAARRPVETRARVDHDYRLPEADEPAITVRRTALGRIEVFADGERLRGRRGVYAVTDANGRTRLFRVAGAWSGLRAYADGTVSPLERPTPIPLLVLPFLPLALVVGGLLGTALGALGVLLNAAILRLPIRGLIRAVLMVAVLAAAAAAWAGIAAALTSVPHTAQLYTTGSCLTGITPGADLVARAPVVVDCSTPHDAEVVGTFRLTQTGDFPGASALRTEAQAQCPVLFAAYVGIEFGASRLDILPLVPTDASWRTGDRGVACLAVTTDGSRRTGSVKGSRQ